MNKIFATALLLLAAPLIGRAQSVYSADYPHHYVTVGAFGSAAQPDIYCTMSVSNCPNVTGTSSNRIYGMGFFGDVQYNRWIHFDIEGRMLRHNISSKAGNDPYTENTALAGVRVPLRRFGHFTPYGKVLAGLGVGTVMESGEAFVLSYGGGIDYRLSKRITVRAADFEYQHWFANNTTTALQPYMISVGISYRLFPLRH